MRKTNALLFCVLGAVCGMLCGILFHCVVSYASGTENSQSRNEQEVVDTVLGRFVVIEREYLNIWRALDAYTVYDKDTFVVYFLVEGRDFNCSISPLYNSDGTIMVYEE